MLSIIKIIFIQSDHCQIGKDQLSQDWHKNLKFFFSIFELILL